MCCRPHRACNPPPCVAVDSDDGLFVPPGPDPAANFFGGGGGLDLEISPCSKAGGSGFEVFSAETSGVGAMSACLTGSSATSELAERPVSALDCPSNEAGSFAGGPAAEPGKFPPFGGGRRGDDLLGRPGPDAPNVFWAGKADVSGAVVSTSLTGASAT